ncbi:unnamed protein product [Heligmosomoides polygyrus]|uniref:ADK_lid domain-containing protein n=1 Tax=Heligmosomoides polygyrus TaxID=6339 RepID=A0A183FFD7_HELPZ|nr:unnamed protein product [Heligmosomoides polygyrus]
MFRVLLSGPAGSGKHTIAKMLLKEFDNFGYFSAGDFIRDHIQRGTEFGQRASSFLRKGELIPDSIVNGVLFEEIRRRGDKLILDGYPRSMAQLKAIEEVSPLDLVVELNVRLKVLIDRLSKQLVHPASGRTYNVDFDPPKVEVSANSSFFPFWTKSCRLESVRYDEQNICPTVNPSPEDDAAEVVRRRLEVHDKTEKKVVDYYRWACWSILIIFSSK